jgi:hypothetical protein
MSAVGFRNVQYVSEEAWRSGRPATVFLWNSRPAFAVITTVPWNHTTKRYQTDLLERHDGIIEIEKLGIALIIALFVGYLADIRQVVFSRFSRFLRFLYLPALVLLSNRVKMDFLADSVPSSPLTDPAVDTHDVDVEMEPDFDAPRASTPASTSSSLLWPSASRPLLGVLRTLAQGHYAKRTE